ncbi:MAG TPA: NADH-quinone oxidoreductase subunit J, partial [Acidimicrobiales bacterium]|nr:NADH-quinone oxidoreductase subunit J [Acidimicrobiales bacterium]
MIATSYSAVDVLVFVTAAVLILAGAVGVLAARNPIHSALSLIMTLFGVAVAFVAQSADFLAAVQIIVYAGAIVVLFLFVIMFLGVDQREGVRVEPLVGQRALGAVGVAVTVAGIVTLMARSHWVTGATAVSTNGVRSGKGA